MKTNLNDFSHIPENRRADAYKGYFKNLTYEGLDNKVLEIEDELVEENFKIIYTFFFKKNIICGCALHKLFY